MYLPFLSQGSTTTGIRTAPHAAVFYEFGNTLFRCDFCSVLNWSIDLRLGVVGLTLTSDCGFSMCVPSSVTRQERNSFSRGRRKRSGRVLYMYNVGDLETWRHMLLYCHTHSVDDVLIQKLRVTPYQKLGFIVVSSVELKCVLITSRPKRTLGQWWRGPKSPKTSPPYLSSRPQILS